MRIEPPDIGPAGPVGPKGPGRVEKPESAQGPEAIEGVAASGRVAEAQLAARIISQTPEVRLQRINELRARIEAGEFKVDANEVAERILEEQ